LRRGGNEAHAVRVSACAYVGERVLLFTALRLPISAKNRPVDENEQRAVRSLPAGYEIDGLAVANREARVGASGVRTDELAAWRRGIGSGSGVGNGFGELVID
jgi:hypothetical protein